jgi:hypothetical protein
MDPLQFQLSLEAPPWYRLVWRRAVPTKTPYRLKEVNVQVHFLRSGEKDIDAFANQR